MESITTPVGKLKSGFNYRRKFDATAMSELTDNIKQNGLLQRILVRPVPGEQYEIIAGGRRAEAFKRAFGENAMIPVDVREMSDEEATAAMVSENRERQDTTAVEDAEAATRMLGLLKGDKEEAALRLGWKLPFLSRRLALMNAIAPVRDAFLDDKIKLGHLELLAALRKEVQENVIVKLIESPEPISVEALHAMANQALLNLDAAIFDKAECATCNFYTGHQQAMFETTFEGTRCTNRECYEKKTEAELEARRSALTDTYQVVRIVRPGENGTVTPLRADGKNGVGEDQAKACRTCGNFGACISAVPDKLGKAFTDVCFDTTCHGTKVQAWTEAQQQANASAADSKSGGDKQQPSQGAASSGEAKAPQKAEKPAAQASSEPRNVVREYREGVWREVFKRAALKLPVEKSRALLLAVCLFQPRSLDSHTAAGVIAKATADDRVSSIDMDVGKLLAGLLTFNTQQLGVALQHIPAYVRTDMDIRSVVGLLTALEIKIEDYWVINGTFLDVLTKTEIDAVCVELGVDKALGEGYVKLKNGSKAEFVKAILAVDGFQYRGAIPALMRW